LSSPIPAPIKRRIKTLLGAAAVENQVRTHVAPFQHRRAHIEATKAPREIWEMPNRRLDWVGVLSHARKGKTATTLLQRLDFNLAFLNRLSN
jgi:hypothetical protein